MKSTNKDFMKRFWSSLNIKSISKFIKWTLLYVSLFFMIAFVDLHYVGTKSAWTGFDKFRVSVYVRTGIAVGYLVPDIKPVSMICNYLKLFNAFLHKELPDIELMNTPREVLLNTEGNSKKENDNFKAKLLKHEAKAMKNFKNSGVTRYINEVNQHVSFRPYGLPIYDIWRVLLCTDIINGEPKTSFLVWGMGVTPDKNAPTFFGSQVGMFGKIIPLIWFNRLESQGLAKGYWSLLSETNETSKFSYAARHMKPTERKNKWLNEVKTYHLMGKGASVLEIYKLNNQ